MRTITLSETAPELAKRMRKPLRWQRHGWRSIHVMRPYQRTLQVTISMTGNRTQALGYLHQALELSADNDASVLFEAAMVHNQLGEIDSALKWLARAISKGYSLATISDAPALDNLHANSKFRLLLTDTRLVQH